MAMATIDELLDSIDEVLEEGASVPFSGGKRMVDVEHVRDLLESIRMNMPIEIERAKDTLRERANILKKAHEDGDVVVRRAEERAEKIVSQEAVVRAAAERAGDITAKAQAKSRELRTKTTDYCDALLRDAEEQLAKSGAEVKALRAKMRQSGKSGMRVTPRRPE